MSIVLKTHGGKRYANCHNGFVTSEWGPPWLLSRLYRNEAEGLLFTSGIVCWARWLLIVICCLCRLVFMISHCGLLWAHRVSICRPCDSKSLYMKCECPLLQINFITGSMEQSPSWEANTHSACQEIFSLHGTQMFISTFKWVRHWGTWIQSTSCFLNIYVSLSSYLCLCISRGPLL